MPTFPLRFRFGGVIWFSIVHIKKKTLKKIRYNFITIQKTRYKNKLIEFRKHVYCCRYVYTNVNDACRRSHDKKDFVNLSWAQRRTRFYVCTLVGRSIEKIMTNQSNYSNLSWRRSSINRHRESADQNIFILYIYFVIPKSGLW